MFNYLIYEWSTLSGGQYGNSIQFSDDTSALNYMTSLTNSTGLIFTCEKQISVGSEIIFDGRSE